MRRPLVKCLKNIQNIRRVRALLYSRRQKVAIIEYPHVVISKISFVWY